MGKFDKEESIKERRKIDIKYRLLSVTNVMAEGQFYQLSI